ncbi:hypothetical protein TTHERM_01027690 (macronuclear) [Tetrahymena thermophila SB210]|uniref:Uncharacterized protein n=1 Tax=Tetrahymena thermophila (strain SB210) TaxID=312017 RepID=Q22CK9_TETTS|nr:hypothetical protein TTHERM_01027690 [Tetrahymena thermophila SB210]EAR83043.1 hypothetical protein TTHERM_01027690 [Tetrahymena thermophila SB210]|eukprot:XP_001030706.1 hypothetical protein TTHERM_01027690 [Tetrahymena thermophila SB210]
MTYSKSSAQLQNNEIISCNLHQRIGEQNQQKNYTTEKNYITNIDPMIMTLPKKLVYHLI